jgi:hypothetical protein
MLNPQGTNMVVAHHHAGNANPVGHHQPANLVNTFSSFAIHFDIIL